ncbi:MAG TPA: cytochrome b/b6 domain-containing protein [Allosphingosinicella sp.]|nr:cytochrome b/b6 domain-containing protein [Allosphingosinicella sp.]
MGDESPPAGAGPPAAAGGRGYGAAAMALHWALALLILVATGLALFREAFASQGVWMISAHKATGLTVLVLALARLAWRPGPPPPPLAGEIGRREAAVARAVHHLLLGLAVLVPRAGWAFVSLAPDARPLDYRGLASVPELPLAEEDSASFAWHEAHELLGFALVGLLLVHLAGALRHSLPGRETLTERMLPRRPRWLRRLVLFALLLWLAGLALDLAGIRLT